MPTPVTVTGTFDIEPGVVISGLAIWQLSDSLFDASGRIICASVPLEFPIINGVMSASLWSNDDSVPSGTTWLVKIQLTYTPPGGTVSMQVLVLNQTFVLSHTMAPTIDISQLTPEAASSPAFPVNAVEIQGVPVASIAPTAGQGLVYNVTTNRYEPAAVSGGGAVSSVFGRTGAVVAGSGDYTAEQIGPSGAFDVAENLVEGVPATMRTNMGLGTAATHASTDFDVAGAAAAAQSTAESYADTSKLAKASNLSDVADAGSARQNIHVPSLTPAACAATVNVALSGLQTIDGYTLAAGDLVLLAAQTTGLQNGLWAAAAGSWTRPTEFPSGGVTHGRTCAVMNGTAKGGHQYLLETPTGGVTIDTTAQTWVDQTGTSVQGIPPALGSQPFAQGSTGDGTGVITASSYCGFAQGYATRSGAITAVVGFAQGYAASGSIDVTGYGAFGSGVVFDAGSAIKATNSGSFAQGCARMTGTIQSTGVGGFAQGYADAGGIVEAATGALAAGSATAPSAILSAGPFSTTLGHATGAGASITSSNGGCAVGKAGAGGSLIASASGSFARGYAGTSGTIQATNQGSSAGGMSNGTTDQGVITSSGYGSFAHGYAYANGGATAITASGKGSFAHGYVKAGSIVASADNAAQFGPGTNAQADSMQIGNGGIRLLGKAAAQPQTTYQNGDIWVGADGHVKVRSNGATVSL